MAKERNEAISSLYLRWHNYVCTTCDAPSCKWHLILEICLVLFFLAGGSIILEDKFTKICLRINKAFIFVPKSVCKIFSRKTENDKCLMIAIVFTLCRVTILLILQGEPARTLGLMIKKLQFLACLLTVSSYLDDKHQDHREAPVHFKPCQCICCVTVKAHFRPVNMLLGGALETLPRANSVPEKRFVLDARIVVIIRIILEIIVKGRSNPNSIRTIVKAKSQFCPQKSNAPLKQSFVMWTCFWRVRWRLGQERVIRIIIL